MEKNIKYHLEINTLTAIEFIELSKAVGWGVERNYDMSKVSQALEVTSLSVVIRDHEGKALGCGRVFSDDLFMSFIPDIFIRPEYQKCGFGKLIIEKMKERYGHTGFFFGAQPGNEPFFEKLGFQKSMQSYAGQFKKNPHYC